MDERHRLALTSLRSGDRIGVRRTLRGGAAFEIHTVAGVDPDRLRTLDDRGEPHAFSWSAETGWTCRENADVLVVRLLGDPPASGHFL